MPRKQGPRLYWRLSNVEHPHADLDRAVREHLLTHAIQVVFPIPGKNVKLEEELEAYMAAMVPVDEGFQVIRASLAEILFHVLGSSVLQQDGASLQALSLTERLDSGNGVAITPDGRVRLAVDKEVHQRMGITGVASTSSPDRFNITLDLKAQSMAPGADRYERVLARLKCCLPPQSFILRLEVGGQLRPLGLPLESLTPEYGAESWMPLRSDRRLCRGLLLPPLARATFEQLGACGPRKPFKKQQAGAEAGAGTGAGGQQHIQGAGQGGQGQQGDGTGGGQAAGVSEVQHHTQGNGAAAAARGPGPGGRGGGGGAEEGGELQRQMAELGVGVGEEEEEVEEQGEPPAPLSREEEARLHYVLNGLHSWLGGVACGMGSATCNLLLPDAVMPLHVSEAPTRADVGLPEEEDGTGCVLSRTWRGLLSQTQVRQVMYGVRDIVAGARVPWAAVHVWGFADAPVAWQGLEHAPAWDGAGESAYTVLFMSEGDFCVFKALGPNEVPMA